MSKGSGTTGDPGRIGAQLDRDDNIDNKPWSELRHEATDKFNEGEHRLMTPACRVVQSPRALCLHLSQQQLRHDL